MNVMSDNKYFIRYADVRNGKIGELDARSVDFYRSNENFFIAHSESKNSELIPIKNILEIIKGSVCVGRDSIHEFMTSNFRIKEMATRELKQGRCLSDFFETVTLCDLKNARIYVSGKSDAIDKTLIASKLERLQIYFDSNISKNLNFVFILGSEDKLTKKITKAMELRNQGSNIRFVNESELIRFLNSDF